MSLVGPRPEEAALVARYTDDQRRRLAVKPGMTGPMQVNGRGDLPFDQRLALELDYIEHYSLRRDLVILARTLPAVVRGKGAY
jgi:lipopolysaccharide/colanic/teichoic acid biosynthesis glycosyltransferase